MNRIFVLFLLSLQTAAPRGSHSIWLLATYIKGQTPFPQFSYILMLDDIRVLYYNCETRTFIRRGNTTNEDTVFDSNLLLGINDQIQASFVEKLAVATQNLNKTDSVLAFQKLVSCELEDNGEPGQMITRYAFEGSTTDELRYIEKSFTYQGTLNVTAQVLNIHLDISKWRHKHLYYPFCIKLLKAYLSKRRNQVNRRVTPRVRIIKKTFLNSGGSQVSCLATGFYPRHINLTLFRDGQPVTDDVTGGDLRPNDDGTYQMRKILEISAEEQREKHKYTCTATHVSLDNKLDVSLALARPINKHKPEVNFGPGMLSSDETEFDHGTPIKPVMSSILTVLALFIVTVVAVIIWIKRHAAFKSEYSSASTSQELVDTAS